jgi:hypothetical protein
MLAKMPQKTAKSPFKNKFTILSLVLLTGLGLSAAYFTVPFLQAPLPAPNNLIGNTTNTTESIPVSTPVSHTNTSSVKIQGQQAAPTANSTSDVNTTKTDTTKQNTNTSKTSSTNNSKTTKTSKTNPSKNTKTVTNGTN